MSDPVILAVGDWVATSAPELAHAVQTVAIIAATPSDAVLALGDISNDAGSAEEYVTVAATLDGIKSRLRPVPGNHDFLADPTAGASYWSYFGAQAGVAGEGWYSFDLPNDWHLIALNSQTETGIGADGASEQGLWLAADLAANAGKHIIAYWHEPVVSSFASIGQDPQFWKSAGSFWHQLYMAGAEIVLNGHTHMYERFAHQDWNGNADRAGIRQFIVGTGYSNHQVDNVPQNLERVASGDGGSTIGVLKLTLGTEFYDWEFLRVPIWAPFSDTGRTRLHTAGPPSTGLVNF